MVALIRGVPMVRVRVKKGAESGVEPLDPASADQRDLICIAYAGAAAERLGTGNHNARPSESDKVLGYQAMARLQQQTKELLSRQALQEAAESQASDLFRTRQEDLLALARYLCHHLGTPGGIPWHEVQEEWNRICHSALGG